jgi:dTDP-4-dehydrorhamnose 3,5-epimerase
MIFKESKIKGAFEIQFEYTFDKRGFFMRTYDKELFVKYNLDRNWLQENHSRSEKKGTIRGFHFQFPPFAETKLIRCIKGAVLDVFVDIRLNSKTFGQFDSVELSEYNKKMAYIPRGFAHGFCTLTDISEVIYKVDNVYKADHECGIIWNDKDINFNWNVTEPVLSEKDKKNITLKEFREKYKGIEL